jgi:hypothetical protein
MMPYIKLADRTKFKDLVLNTVPVIMDGTETPYIQGEYFGYLVNRAVRRFLNTTDADQNFFNSAFFNESKKKSLMNAADKIAAMLNRADPLGAAGELNYAITAIYWGILGDAEGISDARYGVRAYMTGILVAIADKLEAPSNLGNQRDATMAFRRYLICQGVLRDIPDETYRRKTSFYEDEKKLDNRDIWLNGELIVPPPAEEE